MSDYLVVFAFEEGFSFSILESSIHEYWAWQYSSTLKSDRNYSPSDCFESFPFPQNLSEYQKQFIDKLGESYFESRSKFMYYTQLGLTKTYNQFHNPQLTPEVEDLSSKEFKNRYGKATWNLYNHLDNKKAGRVSYAEAVPMIEELRRLHQEMDEAVLAAYGWPDIALRHDFYEVDYLPENDNIRFTIHPEARREVLKRLLLLNHERYEEEVEQGLHGKKGKAGKAKKKEKKGDEGQGRLF